MIDSLPWMVAVLAALVAGCCAAADGAVLALRPSTTLPGVLQGLYERRERTHRALAFARVMAQLTAGLSVALALDLRARPTAEDVAIRLLAAVVLVGASESLSRSFGTVTGERMVRRLAPFITVADTLLAPVAALGGWIDATLHRLLPPPELDEDDRGAAAEQFLQVVAAEAEATQQEEVLLKGVFRLGDTEVHDIMIPRVDIVAIDRDTPWSEVVDRLRSAEHARLPVYRDTIDDVIGILYAKDLLPTIVADEVPDDWIRFVRPAVFIPATKKADQQLRDFQASGSHMAIIADEYGGTAGLITIEDVLEEIVGDIRDEYDEEEAPVIDREGDERFWVSARLTLEDLSELLGGDFAMPDVSTVGGLIYETLGRVPRAGEQLHLPGFRVIVERVVRRRVQRVYFERLPVERGGEPVAEEAS